MDRPLILRGKTVIRNIDEYIIGKVIKNKNVENKKNYIYCIMLISSIITFSRLL